MEKSGYTFSSGLPSLDTILKGVKAGDNVVWQVDSIDDFIEFVHPYCYYISREKKKLIYFRFAQHPSFVPPGVEAVTFHLDPQTGFEHFVTQILKIIEKYGKGVYYLFDCLSGLAVDWFSDRMLGNFFMLTCPYLFDYDTVTYFVLLRNLHTPLALQAIHNTAQVIIDVYKNKTKTYILPIKVWKRYSKTMYMLHSRDKDIFTPVLNSSVLSDILSNIQQPWIDFNIDRKDTWTNTFIQAQKTFHTDNRQELQGETDEEIKQKLIKMSITRDKGLYELCSRYLDISDLITIGKRMIGTGLIGGKAVGMLLARAILMKKDPGWEQLLETHDSFFIGSDIYYTYIIKNKCWWPKYNLTLSKTMFKDAEIIQEKLLHGTFPREIIEQFKEMLNYFGQSPIIVRSSSLLEDAYGNAFSGKYESVFCTNQGIPEERLSAFIKAVQTVYASTLSKNALSYRMHRGLLDRDEQMAILVQRVSGSFYYHLYYPHVAGVGYSYNPYVWNSKIDPKKGVLRLVFGLGTRAVDRYDDDYTRVIALNAPLLRPESTFNEVRKYTQRNIDVLDLDRHTHDSCPFEKVVQTSGEYLPLEIFAGRDREMEDRAKEMNLTNIFPWVLTFEHLLTKTDFVHHMIEMLETLNNAYEHAVDIEFTANFFSRTDFRINLLQCRPFQFSGKMKEITLPENIKKEDIILKTSGPIIGHNTMKKIDTIIYVFPEKYGKMTMSDRFSVARLVGELSNIKSRKGNIMLLGPGRWGTTMPALGIPVSFAEIKNVSVICEIVKMHEGLVPDISLGTHFFNDLVEMDILYIALFPEKSGYMLNESLFKKLPNHLLNILPGATSWEETICVINTDDLKKENEVMMYVDTISQKGLLF
jgi:pyruvate, water dikinase